MNRHHVLTFALLEGLILEDHDAIHQAAQAIKAEDLTELVLSCVSALLCTSLLNAHGSIGAVAQLDQARAQLAEVSL